VPYGPVRSVHIPKDKETQYSRGFAFVTFQRHEHAVAAMENWENRSLDGLILHPRWATAKKSATENGNKKKRNGSRKTKTP
jgi:RNA recognition motif-containing protein